MTKSEIWEDLYQWIKSSFENQTIDCPMGNSDYPLDIKINYEKGERLSISAWPYSWVPSFVSDNHRNEEFLEELNSIYFDDGDVEEIVEDPDLNIEKWKNMIRKNYSLLNFD